MVKIPGIAFLIIGGIMAGYSKFIESRTDNSTMTVFFWIGVVFIVVGVLKLIFEISFRKSRKEKKLSKRDGKKQERLNRYDTQEKNYYDQQIRGQDHHVERASQPVHQSIISCQRCGTKHYSHANFCQKCGNQIK